MMNLTEEEEDQPINVEYAKIARFLHENECTVHFKKDLGLNILKGDQEIFAITFSDMYYPKNLLKHLEERIKCHPIQ